MQLAPVVMMVFATILGSVSAFLRSRVSRRPRVQEVPGRQWDYKVVVAGLEECNPDGTSRRQLVQACRSGEPLMLLADPLNKFGRNAVMVCRANGQQLGFIAADLARAQERVSDFYAEIDTVSFSPLGMVVRLARLEELQSTDPMYDRPAS